jgi:hypothetical protein
VENLRPVHPLLLVYKELSTADLLKLQAISNVSASGGGARDLRLPRRTFRPVMHRIFTQETTKRGRQIRIAEVTYKDASGVWQHTELEYWPPTSSRPSEDRVSKVHASPALGGQLPQTGKGRIFVVFIKWDNIEVRCYYAYEGDLKTPGVWAGEVRAAILGCMNDTDAKNTTRNKNKLPVQGYVDFTNGTVFCNAS